MLTLTADTIPSAQLYAQENRIQTSECIKHKYTKITKFTNRYN